MVSSFVVEYWLDSHRYIAFHSMDDLLCYAAAISSHSEFNRAYRDFNHGEIAPLGLYNDLLADTERLSRIIQTTGVYVITSGERHLLEMGLEQLCNQ